VATYTCWPRDWVTFICLHCEWDSCSTLHPWVCLLVLHLAQTAPLPLLPLYVSWLWFSRTSSGSLKIDSSNSACSKTSGRTVKAPNYPGRPARDRRYGFFSLIRRKAMPQTDHTRPKRGNPSLWSLNGIEHFYVILAKLWNGMSSPESRPHEDHASNILELSGKSLLLMHFDRMLNIIERCSQINVYPHCSQGNSARQRITDVCRL